MNKAALLEEMALKTETVELKSGTVTVTELSADDYMAVYDSPLGKTDGEYDGAKFPALLAVRCMFDGDGNRIFSDEDAETFRKGSIRVYHKITAAVNRVNGLAGDEVKN